MRKMRANRGRKEERKEGCIQKEEEDIALSKKRHWTQEMGASGGLCSGEEDLVRLNPFIKKKDIQRFQVR